ncbi:MULTISPECIES: hypothetical protein [unclassified Nostoc]|nr:hypothetical protein [Nostoc sp. DedQUE03]MDZ7975782.1 hypothetical protein [Nostoc sp. DedQUE03]MDZ8048315.1 hypothetical protein [Nostoc sp. DedQUE02]
MSDNLEPEAPPQSESQEDNLERNLVFDPCYTMMQMYGRAESLKLTGLLT